MPDSKTEAESPLVSVAIATLNRRDHVLYAIRSVYEQDYCPVEIVVVDSGSSDGTPDAIRRQFPRVVLVQLHRNLGSAEGHNVAMANCRGDVIFSLDDDGYLGDGALRQCVEWLWNPKNPGVVACQIVQPSALPEIPAATRTNRFGAGAFALRRDILETVGYFPGDFFLQGEERDLALRIIDSGNEIVYLPSAVVFHHKAPEGRNSKRRAFYSCRNDLYVVVRRYPIWLVAGAILWKAVRWNLWGLANGTLLYTAMGALAAGAMVPRLLLQRAPVSFEAIRKYISLRDS